MSDTVAFMLIGAGLLVVDAMLFVRRRWFARVMCNFMFPVLHPLRRADKETQLEAMFRILLGLFLPVFILLLLALVAAQ